MTTQPTTTKEALEPRLKPCRCGRKALIERFYDGDDPQPLFVATCEVCPVKTYDQFSMEEAARIWNEFVSATVNIPDGQWQHVQIKAGNPRVVAIQFETPEQATAFINSFASAPIVAPVVDESGWLLEKMHEGNVHYIAADYVLQWTDDPNKALRLARREDAEALCTIVEDCEKIAEHGWPAPALRDEADRARHVGSSRHPHFTAADHHRMKETLDALSDYPTEEEAEAALQACGTSGKEVVNGFIDQLLKENLELKTKLESATTPPSTLAKAATDEIVKGWFWHLPERDQHRARVNIAAIIERCLAGGGEEQ